MWGSQGHWLGKQCTEKGENFTSACKVESKSMTAERQQNVEAMHGLPAR